MNPKIILNIIVFIFGTIAYYGVTLFVLLFLISQFNDSFRNIYLSALPLALISMLPLIGFKIQSKYDDGHFSTFERAIPLLKNEVLMALITYILITAMLFILRFAANDSIDNAFLSALPLVAISVLFLYSYKFWEFIKGSQ